VTPASAADMAAEAVNRFGFRLLDRSKNESAQNLLLSPYSIAICLAIACNGAAGDTRDALAVALGAQDDEQAMNRSLQDLRPAVDQAGPLVEMREPWPARGRVRARSVPMANGGGRLGSQSGPKPAASNS